MLPATGGQTSPATTATMASSIRASPSRTRASSSIARPWKCKASVSRSMLPTRAPISTAGQQPPRRPHSHPPPRPGQRPATGASRAPRILVSGSNSRWALESQPAAGAWSPSSSSVNATQNRHLTARRRLPAARYDGARAAELVCTRPRGRASSTPQPAVPGPPRSRPQTARPSKQPRKHRSTRTSRWPRVPTELDTHRPSPPRRRQARATDEQALDGPLPDPSR